MGTVEEGNYTSQGTWMVDIIYKILASPSLN